MEFQIKDIRPDAEILDLLTSYGQHLNKTSTPDRDKHILRLELHLKTIRQNRHLDYELYQHFPHSYYYEHVLSQADGNLTFHKANIKHIVNSVGNHALFGEEYSRLRKEIIPSRNTHKKPTVKVISNLQFYDYLPAQFLIGRIWCIENLCAALEDIQSLDKQFASAFEYLNYEVSYPLRHLPLWSPNRDYSALHMTVSAFEYLNHEVSYTLRHLLLWSQNPDYYDIYNVEDIRPIEESSTNYCYIMNLIAHKFLFESLIMMQRHQAHNFSLEN